MRASQGKSEKTQCRRQPSPSKQSRPVAKSPSWYTTQILHGIRECPTRNMKPYLFDLERTSNLVPQTIIILLSGANKKPHGPIKKVRELMPERHAVARPTCTNICVFLSCQRCVFPSSPEILLLVFHRYKYPRQLSDLTSKRPRTASAAFTCPEPGFLPTASVPVKSCAVPRRHGRMTHKASGCYWRPHRRTAR